MAYATSNLVNQCIFSVSFYTINLQGNIHLHKSNFNYIELILVVTIYNPVVDEYVSLILAHTGVLVIKAHKIKTWWG